MPLEDFGEEVVNHATRLVMDGLAVAVAGAHLDPIAVLWKVSQGLAGTGDASVIGHGASCAADVAAYVNGAAMHVLDYEAMWSPATHATSTTLPAVLALAEERGADGQQVLTALIAGSFEEMHVTLDVELTDGQILSARCDRPRGYIGTPIPEHDHLRKVKDCLSRGGHTSNTDRIVSWCRSLSSLNALALKRLMHVLRS